MVYVFVSFGSLHTRKNIGCCIVQVEREEDANGECARLGLMPQECNEAKGFHLPPESFAEQGMELNRFYTRDEMEQMGFERV